MPVHGGPYFSDRALLLPWIEQVQPLLDSYCGEAYITVRQTRPDPVGPPAPVWRYDEPNISVLLSDGRTYSLSFGGGSPPPHDLLVHLSLLSDCS